MAKQLEWEIDGEDNFKLVNREHQYFTSKKRGMNKVYF